MTSEFMRSIHFLVSFDPSISVQDAASLLCVFESVEQVQSFLAKRRSIEALVEELHDVSPEFSLVSPIELVLTPVLLDAMIDDILCAIKRAELR